VAKVKIYFGGADSEVLQKV